MVMKNRNADVLADFVRYCGENPDLRFWQALTNWSGVSRVNLVTTVWSGKCSENDPRETSVDPYYWEGKDS